MEWLPTPVFLPGESPWTEEPGGLQSMGLLPVSLGSTPLSALTVREGLKGQESREGHPCPAKLFATLGQQCHESWTPAPMDLEGGSLNQRGLILSLGI